MNKKKKTNIKKGVANFFGSLGYLFCALQWFWTVLLYYSLIQSLAIFISINTTNQVSKPTPIVPVANNLALSSSATIVAIIITIIVIFLAIYIIIKIPSIIVKTGKKIVQKTAETTVPLVIRAQHKKDTKKFHLQLTSCIIVIIKTVLVVVPVALAFASKVLEEQAFDFSLTMYLSLWLASLSVVFFFFQYLLASLLQIKRQYLW
jgi:hypothetical protein